MTLKGRVEVEERTVNIVDLFGNQLYKGSPLIFNIIMKSEKSRHVVGLTFREAKELERQLRLKLKKMMKNPKSDSTS